MWIVPERNLPLGIITRPPPFSQAASMADWMFDQWLLESSSEDDFWGYEDEEEENIMAKVRGIAYWAFFHPGLHQNQGCYSLEQVERRGQKLKNK